MRFQLGPAAFPEGPVAREVVPPQVGDLEGFRGPRHAPADLRDGSLFTLLANTTVSLQAGHPEAPAKQYRQTSWIQGATMDPPSRQIQSCTRAYDRRPKDLQTVVSCCSGAQFFGECVQDPSDVCS